MSLVIGLTGGIASGKSTVSAMLREIGVPVIDADVIAHQVVKVGQPAYNEIVNVFGDSILKADKTIDRPQLGSIVFNNEQKRLVLNSIVHPAVRQAMLSEKNLYIQQGHSVVVLDIPLLFESKLTSLVDKVLVVYVDEEIQLARLIKRNQLTETEALARISSQMPLKNKVELADAVINNNGTIEDSQRQLFHILKEWHVKF
ncbi:dephospho-CoA kinase [Bacillus sp. HMF5848]|uniref:dephospho-CoA kinase n=1 Tax=Bacillus sp. HMF5848 TaxID=2495421 RepID=UPI000F776EBD|nr:dephospho-CoA kinase [Bacillus sp. HMF5848]RSK28122.1 dephospho-CoA kinase [Bacillus sp. HMF5848]